MIVLANSSELSAYAKAQKGYELSPGELWRHSVITAILSQLLIKKAKLQVDSALFTAALLHDVGKLVLNTYIEGEIGNLVEVTQKEGLSLIEAEREAFGIDHAELGGIIAETWQFPSALINSIKNHHKDRSEDFVPNIEAWARLSNLVYYVSLARSVYSYHKGITCQIDPSVLFRFNLNQKHIDEVTAELPAELKKIEGLLKTAM
jgi:putative nucleotidyltransferase with HDIG domain